MALVLADRVLETTTTTGSGTITLAGAKQGYQSFAVVGNGNTTYYTISGSTEWEVGIGTYTSSGTTLSRDTVLSSSSGGGKVTFSAGTKDVFVTYPAARSVESTSATITTLSGTTADYTTITGTTIGTTATTQLRAASANITTATGTTFSATTMGAQSTTTFLGTSANITTLSGTNFSATSLTLTNALAVASGGSGRASTTAYAVICGGTTSTGPEQSIASVGTSGQVLTSNGAGALPTFQTLVVAGLPTMNVVSGTTQTAVANNQYVLTNAAATTVTLPASPSAGDTVYITVANSLTTNVVARNGNKIQSLSEDMTLNAQYAAVQLRYADATRGWVLT